MPFDWFRRTHSTTLICRKKISDLAVTRGLVSSSSNNNNSNSNVVCNNNNNRSFNTNRPFKNTLNSEQSKSSGRRRLSTRSSPDPTCWPIGWSQPHHHGGLTWQLKPAAQVRYLEPKYQMLVSNASIKC
jgi:hypothetical protein